MIPHSLSRASILYLLMAAFAFAPVADWILPHANTLERYPHWQSTTILRERMINHAQDFLSGPQALAGNQLNLHAWHGYQELILQKPLPEEAIVSLRFKLNPYTWLVLGYNHTPESFAGFMLSGEDPERAAVVSAVEDGRFAYRRQEAALQVAPEVWHTARIRLYPDGATLWINGERATTLSIPPVADSHLGLRGGLYDVVVDDVVVRDKAGRVRFQERFSRAPLEWIRRAGAGIVAAVAAGLLLFLLQRRVALSPESLNRASISLFLCGGVLWPGTLLLYPLTLDLYPSLTPKQEYEEAAFVENHAHMIAESAASAFSREKPADVYRILLLGTSQIWGAGALREADRVDAVMTDLLEHQRIRGKRIEVLNGAIPGASAPRLHQEYRERWHAYDPDFVVVNLGMNDTRNSTFETDLRGLLQEVLNHRKPLLFTAEPVSVEWRERLDTHEVLKSIAAEKKVPFIDLHGRVAVHHHSGLLWLDYVHATSYGQRMIAEILVAELCRRLNCQPEGAPLLPVRRVPR